MYKIGELSRLCALPSATLRYYDAEGLLTPDYIDPFTGYRYYEAARIGDCFRITAWKSLGYSLDEIRQYLAAEDTETVLELLDAKAEELRETLSLVQSRLRRIEAAMEIMKKGDTNMSVMNLVIRKSEAVRAAAIRRVYRSREDALRTLEALYDAIPKQVRGRKMLINYETEYGTEDNDCAAAVEILGNADISRLPLPDGCETVLVDETGEEAVLACGKEQVMDTYGELLRAAANVPVTVTGAYREIYYNDDTAALTVPVARLIPAEEAEPAEELPFEDDTAVHGTWELCDIVPSAEQFLPGHRKTRHGGWLAHLHFLKDGGGYWVMRGWGRGYIDLWDNGTMRSDQVHRCPYEVRTLDGKQYLFLSMRHSFEQRTDLLTPPEMWIYEKTASGDLTKEDIRRRDDTDLPFAADDAVLGTWLVHDFTPTKPETVSAEGHTWSGGLFVKSMEFCPDGSVVQNTENGTNRLAWTKGYVLNHTSETACAYEIVCAGDIEYLLVQWKSGDYVYGRRETVPYYIFTRK